MRVKVTGVYPIETDEPVHLVEMTIEGGSIDGLDVGNITQEVQDQPRSNWQVPYDEQVFSESDRKTRVVFFFHYLNLDKPLLAQADELALPPPQKLPARLKHIVYETP